jgi:hypothetical protein
MVQADDAIADLRKIAQKIHTLPGWKLTNDLNGNMQNEDANLMPIRLRFSWESS